MSEVTISKLLHDLQAVVEDAESLFSATANETGDRVREVRDQAEAAIGRARERLAGLEEQLTDGAQAAMHEADDYVHEHPWLAVGIAAGIGFLAGLLTARR
jgi:ElaB/YqjD/DUF883 family membrane-anchored ribosome-binding protein